MGKVLDLQSFFFNGASGAGVYVPLAAVPGDSLVVKNGKEGSRIRCIAMWQQNEVSLGFGQLLSPLLHDSTRGFRYTVNINTPHNVLPKGIGISLEPQDPLVLSETGSVAGEGNNIHMLNFYEDFGSIDAHLIKLEELLSRQKMLTTVANTITPIAEQVYSAPQLINAGSDLLHANTEYAILGAEVNVTNGALCITAPDFANIRVGIPANVLRKLESRNFFVDLAREFDLPLIPVFNSANRANIIITIITTMAALPGTDFHLLLAELNPQ